VPLSKEIMSIQESPVNAALSWLDMPTSRVSVTMQRHMSGPTVPLRSVPS
jgi:hypothetical protein